MLNETYPGGQSKSQILHIKSLACFSKVVKLSSVLIAFSSCHQLGITSNNFHLDLDCQRQRQKGKKKLKIPFEFLGAVCFGFAVGNIGMLWPFYPCSPKMPWLMPCKQPGMTVISCGNSMRRNRKPRQSCSGLSPREMQKWHSGEQSMRLMPFRELRSWKMPSELQGLQHALDWQNCAHWVLLCAREIGLENFLVGKSL